jgi:surface antigen
MRRYSGGRTRRVVRAGDCGVRRGVGRLIISLGCVLIGAQVGSGSVAIGKSFSSTQLRLAPVAPLIPGGPAVVTGTVPAGHYCELRLRHRDHAVTSKARRATGRSLQFVWLVPNDAAPSAWSAKVACSRSRAFTLSIARSRAIRITVLRRKTRRGGHGAIARRQDITMVSLGREPSIGLGAVSAPHWGTVEVPGTAWSVPGAAGRACGGGVTWPCGVDVKSNGYCGDPSNPYFCVTSHGRVVDLFESPDVTDIGGVEWQCVELVNRLLRAVGWIRQNIVGNGADFWNNAQKVGNFVQEANGNSNSPRPVPGDIVVYWGDTTGHVAIVETVNGNAVTMLEQNASPTGRVTATFNGAKLESLYRGLSIKGWLHAQQDTTTTTVQSSGDHTIAATSVYGGPGTDQGVEGALASGAAITILCQTRGGLVGNSTIWDLISGQAHDGSARYIPDYYASTPNDGTFSPGIAQCGSPPAPPSCADVSASTTAGQPVALHLSCSAPSGQTVTFAITSSPSHGSLDQLDTSAGTVRYSPASGYAGSDSFSYHASDPGGASSDATVHLTIQAMPPAYYIHEVYGTCADGACGLHERSGPGYSNYAITGTLYDGNEVDIVCQTGGQLVTPNHGSASNVWDKLTNGSYVTDVYVDTSGTGGNFSPPIPQC